jgi:hypothetical protein
MKAMIGLEQTQSFEMMKVFLGPRGRTNVRCPFCGKHHYKEVPKHLYNKPVRAKCKCGKSFPVLFDSRENFRTEVQLAGEYWDTFGEKDLMTVTTLSKSGAGFEAARSTPDVSVGESIQVSFCLNGSSSTWINTSAIVKRIDRNRVGVEFIGLDQHQKKCLGFYLMA